MTLDGSSKLNAVGADQGDDQDGLGAEMLGDDLMQHGVLGVTGAIHRRATSQVPR